MRRFKYLGYVVVLMAVLVGSAFGNVESGDIGTSTTEGKECHIETSRPTRMKIVYDLKRVLSRCFGDSNTSPSASLDTIEGRSLFFKNLCDELPAARRCLAEEAKNWASCYNTTLNSVYSVFMGVVETSFNKGCLNDGENFANILSGIARHKYPTDDVMRECVIFATSRWVMAQRSDGDIATKIWITHKEIQRFTDCLNEYAHGEDAFLSLINDLLNDVIDKMKCIHPNHDGLVLCKTIDENLIDMRSICPLRSRNDLSVPLHLELVARATICLIQIEPYTPLLSDANTVEEFRSYFSNYCRRRGRVMHCFNETTMAAGICLNDSDYKSFQLVRGYLNHVYDAGCSEGGRRLATLFHTAKILRNSTSEKDGLMKCLTTVQSARNEQSHDAALRVFQYYQELPIARQCLFDNIQGDDTFRTDVNEFVDEIMAKMKCLNPQNDAIVQCSTLELE